MRRAGICEKSLMLLHYPTGDSVALLPVQSLHVVVTTTFLLVLQGVIPTANSVSVGSTHRHMYNIGLRGRHGDNMLEDYLAQGELQAFSWVN